MAGFKCGGHARRKLLYARHRPDTRLHLAAVPIQRKFQKSLRKHPEEEKKPQAPQADVGKCQDAVLRDDSAAIIHDMVF